MPKHFGGLSVAERRVVPSNRRGRIQKTSHSQAYDFHRCRVQYRGRQRAFLRSLDHVGVYARHPAP